MLLNRENRVYLQYYAAIIDHALLRLFWPNYGPINKLGHAFRSGQPSKMLLRRFKSQGGKTVISLRGGASKPHNVLERKYCKELGLRYINIPLSSTDAPQKSTLLKLINTFKDLDTPFLLHCKTGADRTGLAAGIYLLSAEGFDHQIAKRQLSWRYLHFGQGRKRILRNFFNYYSTDHHEGQTLESWVHTNYIPENLDRI